MAPRTYLVVCHGECARVGRAPLAHPTTRVEHHGALGSGSAQAWSPSRVFPTKRCDTQHAATPRRPMVSLATTSQVPSGAINGNDTVESAISSVQLVPGRRGPCSQRIRPSSIGLFQGWRCDRRQPVAACATSSRQQPRQQPSVATLAAVCSSRQQQPSAAGRTPVPAQLKSSTRLPA